MLNVEAGKNVIGLISNPGVTTLEPLLGKPTITEDGQDFYFSYPKLNPQIFPEDVITPLKTVEVPDVEPLHILKLLEELQLPDLSENLYWPGTIAAEILIAYGMEFHRVDLRLSHSELITKAVWFAHHFFTKTEMYRGSPKNIENKYAYPQMQFTAACYNFLITGKLGPTKEAMDDYFVATTRGYNGSVFD